MILTRYIDNITYSKIFDYLNVNYGFQPKIIHSDFEKAITLAIKNNKLLGNGLIHTRCFFHYSWMVKKNLSKTGIFKKKINPLSAEIITNIQLLCFFNIDKIKDFQKLIIIKLQTYNKNLYGFVKYLKKYLFKLSPKIYNYSEIIEHFKRDNNKNKFLDILYITNNICEPLNSKISYYFPKKQANNFNFVRALFNILSNEILKRI